MRQPAKGLKGGFNTCVELVRWLHQGPIAGLVSEDHYKDLETLARRIDVSGSAPDNIVLMIELHHDTPGRTDISIFGDRWLLRLVNVAEMPRAHQWLVVVEKHGLSDVFPPQYWLEFDSAEDGYRVMGLFQVHNAMPDILEPTSFIRFLRGPSNTAGFLHNILERIGMPLQIGFLERKCESKQVKLVIPLRHQFQATLSDLMEVWFMPLLQGAGLSPVAVSTALRSWVDEGGRAAISVDVALDLDQPGDRLCFELSKSGDQGFETLLRRMHLPYDQIRRCRELRGHLPYGVKLPVFNLVQHEFRCLGISHAKLCIGPNGISLKDYLSLNRRFEHANSFDSCDQLD